jgi:hypothetical protein
MIMGAFCVFGVSRQVCRKLAEKSVPTRCPELKRELTAPEWGGRVMAEADRLFEASEKQVRISPELDAPQFCRDWIAASPGDVKLTRLMYRGPKIDKYGAAVLRDGAPVLTWLPYDESAVWPRPFGEVAHQELVTA